MPNQILAERRPRVAFAIQQFQTATALVLPVLIPYNCVMKQSIRNLPRDLTLVLPFALPPPEMAADLLRALQTPALAALLSRTNRQQFESFDNGKRILPHEAWLAHALGLGAAPSSAHTGAAFAPSVMRGMGGELALASRHGHWFIVSPVHVQIARNHLLMGDQRQLRLDEADARALHEAARPYFADIGLPLLYGNAQTWFMRADAWAGLRTASLDAATGQNLHAWMPDGAHAGACRKLQNDIQMLWFAHPVNAQRQARLQAPVNSFWLWGGGAAETASSSTALFVAAGAPWLAALANHGAPSLAPAQMTFSSLMQRSGNGEQADEKRNEKALLVLDSLTEAGLASDWSNWLMHMQALEQAWFAPALAALKQGQLGQLTLVLSHRSALARFSTSRMAQRKFWRSPSLHPLLTPLLK